MSTATPTPLEKALAMAVAGDAKNLFALLVRASGLPGPRPALGLAASFGQLVKTTPAKVRSQLLQTMIDMRADSGSAEVFLPMCAAFASAFATTTQDAQRLAELAGDDRVEVRRAVIEACVVAGIARQPQRLLALCDHDDKETRWYAFDSVWSVFAREEIKHEGEVMAAALEFSEEALQELQSTSRAQERNPARRVALDAARFALPALVVQARGGGDWFAKVTELGKHPDLRSVFETVLTKLRRKGASQKDEDLARFAQAIDDTKKPPRDPTLFRHETRGRGRGKSRNS